METRYWCLLLWAKKAPQVGTFTACRFGKGLTLNLLFWKVMSILNLTKRTLTCPRKAFCITLLTALADWEASTFMPSRADWMARPRERLIGCPIRSTPSMTTSSLFPRLMAVRGWRQIGPLLRARSTLTALVWGKGRWSRVLLHGLLTRSKERNLNSGCSPVARRFLLVS